MVQPVPAYVRSDGVADELLRYAWDEWTIRKHWDIVEADLHQRIDQLTNRAGTALALATAEWICQRFSLLCWDPRPRQFLEAAWAGNIHRSYCEYTETVTDEWRGPIRGPLNIIILIANDALFCLHEDPHAATRACWMAALARHVLPSAARPRFEAWFEASIERLEAHYPRVLALVSESVFEPFPGMGTPVPAELFDLRADFDPAAAPGLLDQFLRSLDPTQNPYLHPASELAGIEDVPIPYRYVVH
jgi:hypothetical protein